MSENSDGNKDLAGLSAPRCSERKQLEDGVFESDRGKFLLSNSGIKVDNQIGQDIGSSRERSGCVSGVGNSLPQQAVSQGTTVCWERFLHVRSLKVLLVENDDCTRHLVAALLQNCSYEVLEAANGFQAWRILEDISNRIDIVLTEVVMPCVSGLALLNKIMSHKTRKSIPVIMMSSHDSMGVVFKCLSKGAADFLVKPLRKNELKNLWQHVWRRCHSSSGSGSESGTHTKKSFKSQNDEKSDNNSGSNDEEDNGSPPLDFGDGSDHGSGTQNFWTKQAIEEQDESPRPVSPTNELSESPDSTCAQVIHSNNIKQCEKQLEPMSATKEYEEQTEQPEESEMGKAHISKLPNSLDLLFKSLVEVPVELSSMNHSSSPILDSSQFSKPINSAMDLNCVNPATEPDNQVTGIIPGSSDPHKEGKDSDTKNKYSKISNIDGNTVGDGLESRHHEQSLKRLRGTQETGKVVMDDRNIVRRSVSSAFSRYNAAQYSKVSITEARDPSPLEIRLDRTPAPTRNMQSCTGSNMPNQRSNGRSPYKDMISTSNSGFVETINNKDQSSETQRAKREYHPAVQMHPAHYSGHNNPPIDDLPQQHQPPNGNLLLTEKAGSSTHCQSSSMAGRYLEGTAGNYSTNGSGSGSNHGSNEPNGSGCAANVGGVNMQVYDRAGCQSENGNASGSGSGSGNKLDPDKLAQREAALTKYRQKRKELCFKRTVRYQSRKKLAEQRPRIRGQFVKRTLSETSSKGPTDSQI